MKKYSIKASTRNSRRIPISVRYRIRAGAQRVAKLYADPVTRRRVYKSTHAALTARYLWKHSPMFRRKSAAAGRKYRQNREQVAA